MVNLRLDEKEVLTERQVILEERRSRVENSPSAILDEQMNAALYMSHPYGIPVIGWEHEMAKLSPADAMAFYKRFYAPNNAILVVTGDVTADEVKALAEADLRQGPVQQAGDVAAAPAGAAASRRAPRRAQGRARGQGLGASHLPGAELSHGQGGRGGSARPAAEDRGVRPDQPALQEGRDGGQARLQCRRLVFGRGARQRQDLALRGGQPTASTSTRSRRASTRCSTRCRTGGVTAAELERAKKAYLAEYIYESDNQTSLARRYGWSLTVGRTLKDIEEWPARISKVTARRHQEGGRRSIWTFAIRSPARSFRSRPSPTPKAEGKPASTPSRG